MVRMPHWPHILGVPKIDLGLGRVEAVLEELGNPQQHVPPVVHFAGTNGKGSTIAFLRAILEAAKKKVHCYTSPHLIHFNERIILAGQQITDDYLYQIMEESRIAAEGTDVTFFEGTTIGALHAFSKTEADILLLETGLGGRLDATNVFDAPLLTVITTISLDHTEYLGPDVSTIAGEKAGIIKDNRPCVTGPQLPEVMDVLEHFAKERNAPLYRFGEEWLAKQTAEGLYVETEDEILHLPHPNLAGIHQYTNAAVAVMAAKTLENMEIENDVIAQGITQAKWPARLERLQDGMLTKLLPNENWELWLDGAHNEGAAAMLAVQAEEWSDKPLYLIAGMTKGKDGENFFKHFVGKAEYVYCVRVNYEPSAQTAEEVANAASHVGLPSLTSKTLQEAIASITDNGKTAGRILLCGSLYLAGDVLEENEGIRL